MRACIQRVSSARVRVEGETVGEIGRGFLVLLGVAAGDGPAELRWMVDKVVGLRVFDDGEGKRNVALADVGGEVWVVGGGGWWRRGRRRRGLRGEGAVSVWEGCAGGCRLGMAGSLIKRFWGKRLWVMRWIPWVGVVLGAGGWAAAAGRGAVGCSPPGSCDSAFSR